jgi:hypothetical protein
MCGWSSRELRVIIISSTRRGEDMISCRRQQAVIAVIGGLLTLSACKSSDSSSLDYSGPAITHFKPAITHFKGVPRSFKVQQALSVSHPGVAWAPRNRLYVITIGSSSCPELVSAIRANGQHHLVVRTRTVFPKGQTEEHACTADLGPTTSLVAVPAAVDLDSAVTVSIDSAVSVLPARG